ncbi:hypothetical protein IE81DRAFT_369689, partial [Ceraceosorus guamensis]
FPKDDTLNYPCSLLLLQAPFSLQPCLLLLTPSSALQHLYKCHTPSPEELARKNGAAALWFEHEHEQASRSSLLRTVQLLIRRRTLPPLLIHLLLFILKILTTTTTTSSSSSSSSSRSDLECDCRAAGADAGAGAAGWCEETELERGR